MSYAEGGGLTGERRVLRRKLRMEAAERFAQGDENSVIAHDLRVSVRLVRRWRRVWSQNGPWALTSQGPASLPLLNDETVRRARAGTGQGAGGTRLAGRTRPGPCRGSRR
ncbi:helix-turn-helix domain-containing protein [Streptomyces sp. E2N171]|uniref:helix-turn-helix domain-containing protein n=1 Tax=Streptomyces sp. E2N171 TaxID=1851914 RepID=UPI0031BB8D43